jgi:hypothetical protein
MSDLRAKLLTTENIPKERVVLTKFGGIEVEVRSLTTGQRLKLVKECTVDGEVDQYKLIPLLMIATTYDPADGSQVLSPLDVGPLEETYAAGLDDLLAVSLRLNGFDNPTAAVKNSASAQTSTSLSSSPSA